MAKAAKRKIEYITKKAGQSRNSQLAFCLLELCQKIDTSVDSTNKIEEKEDEKQHVHVVEEDTEECLDLDLFDALINYL